MKRLYHNMLRRAEEKPVRLEKTKTFLAEWYSIFRKKPLYKHIKWSKEQQREFDLFWKTHYGKRISNRWHKLYEASNGVHRVDYFPEYLYSTKLEPKLNDYSYTKVLANKNLLDVFFDGKVENVRTPKAFLFCDHGHYYNAARRLISSHEAAQILSNVGEAVMKPTVDSSSGKDVRIVCIKDGIDQKSNESVQQLLQSYKNDFTVQEKITPCDTMAQLYPHAINTVRITTYICNDQVYAVPISLRIGTGGNEVDNIHAGGIGLFVTENGMLSKFAYKLGYGDNFEKFVQHPDTGVVFDNYYLDFIPQALHAVKILHESVSNIGIISWDVTVNNCNEIIILEANYRGQGIWFPQMISGEPLFGENTAEMLKMIRR